jgi:hypothetical protein
VTISTDEAGRSLRFTEIFEGDTLRIVVEAVAIGSQAEKVSHSKEVAVRQEHYSVMCMVPPRTNNAAY